MRRRLLRPTPAKRTGQALVEFALVVPILILLFLGIFDLARLVYVFNAVSDAARNGVREAIVNQDCGAVGNSARSSAPAVDLAASDAVVLTVYKSALPTIPPAPDVCPALGGNYGIGYVTEVRVQTTFTPITPIIGQLLGPIPLASTARLPIERAYP